MPFERSAILEAPLNEGPERWKSADQLQKTPEEQLHSSPKSDRLLRLLLECHLAF